VLRSRSYEPLGHYLLVERLATGGMAEVFLACDRDVSDRTVVIKRMRADLAKDPRAVARFLDEARVSTMCDHPNIVKVYEVGEHRGSYFIAMEWLLGWELKEIMRASDGGSRRLPIRVILTLMLDACRGLEAAHALRTKTGEPIALVHRDLTPRNLFVVTTGILKILDFGIAKSSIQKSQTKVASLLGTLSYMSPEQVTGDSIDVRSDVFSLGIILHELLSGRRLFMRRDFNATMMALVDEFVPPPERDDERVDPTVAALTMRALQRSRDLRFASAADFGAAIEGALAGLGGPPARGELERLFAEILSPESADADPEDSTAGGPHVAYSRWADEDTKTEDAPDPTPTVSERPHSAAATPLSGLGREHRRGSRNAALLGAFAVAVAAMLLVLADPSPQVPRVRPDVPLEDARGKSPRDEPAWAPVDVVPSVVEGEGEEKGAQEDDGQPASAGNGARKRSSIARHRPHLRSSVRKPASLPAGPAKSASATGLLTLDAVPWANVYAGDILLGTTPLVERSLPAGKVTLKLRSPVTGAEREVTLEIPVGGSIRSTVNLP
jgi:eukaryotic-like serine/threonine-protein kinase